MKEPKIQLIFADENDVLVRSIVIVPVHFLLRENCEDIVGVLFLVPQAADYSFLYGGETICLGILALARAVICVEE